MKQRRIFVAITLLFSMCGLLSCQTATKVYEKRKQSISGKHPDLEQAARLPIVINEDTVVLDARGSFDFAMAHIPGSKNIHWEDFAQIRSAYPGKLKNKKALYKMARRLARKGLTPESEVVIVGNGVKGKGQEGRLAWTLYYLGVRNIQFADISYFDFKLTNTINPEPPQKNKPIWKPDYHPSILAVKGEIRKATMDLPTSRNEKVFLLDVRSKKEYFSKRSFGGDYGPDLQAIHIEWKEFLTPQGRPNLEMKARLRAIGMGPESRIIAISNRGVRSAAVAMVLTTMGFDNAANYAGGFKELLK